MEKSLYPQLTFNNAFPISHAQISRSLIYEIVKDNWTLSLDTTIECVILEGALVF